ncbi:MAG: acetyl-CoA C-acyltransferase [Eubacteriales bacterium]
MQEAVIVSAVRTAVGKAPRGALRRTNPVDMAAAVLKEALTRAPGLEPAEIEDVIFGCSFPEAEQGMNAGRMIALRAGLPYTVPGATVNRFCSSGLEAIAIAATRIMAGFTEVQVAGGAESMSLVPMGGNKIAPNLYLMESIPASYISMGLTAENVAARYNVTREDQDLFSVESHEKAYRAIQEGRFKKEILPLEVEFTELGPDGRAHSKKSIFDTDEGVRPGTTMEILAKLKPAFHARGTVTAGNSSQTSDGASAVVLMSRRKAESLGLKPLAVFRSYAVGGVAPEVMGIGPVAAIPKALKLAGIDKSALDLIELNEAFAAQALAVIRELDLNPDIVNVNGGAVALGHPLGCTGAKLTTTLLHEMERNGGRYGLVSMCIGGGMGAAGVFERI